MKRIDYSKDIDSLTHKIIGCAMEVHKELGNGFQEVIYQRALAIEFMLQGLGFEREKKWVYRTKDMILEREGLTFLLKDWSW